MEGCGESQGIQVVERLRVNSDASYFPEEMQDRCWYDPLVVLDTKTVLDHLFKLVKRTWKSPDHKVV